jgi:hypothetical protein
MNDFEQDLKLQRLRSDVDSVMSQRQLAEYHYNRILRAQKNNKIKINITIVIALISILLHGVL